MKNKPLSEKIKEAGDMGLTNRVIYSADVRDAVLRILNKFEMEQ